jgi:hypothetical protein
MVSNYTSFQDPNFSDSLALYFGASATLYLTVTKQNKCLECRLYGSSFVKFGWKFKK